LHRCFYIGWPNHLGYF